jgi:peptidoglycan-associated lipoprotein
MKRHLLKKISLLCVSVVLLTACSTTGTKGGAGGAEDVTTMGLGNEQSIGGYGLTDAYRMKPGYNQIYFFDFDKNDIHANYLPSIDVQANYLLAHPGARVLLTGNTDSRGSHEYNIALGNRRALAVANRLEMDGVPKRQIRVVSYGAEKPIAPGDDDRSYALNRNVQLIFEAKG